jgi:hypothetical protein
VGAALVGLVGVAFFLGVFSTCRTTLDAAHAAGSPSGLTIALGVVSAIFGLGFAALGGGELLARLRNRREQMEVRHES